MRVLKILIPIMFILIQCGNIKAQQILNTNIEIKVFVKAKYQVGISKPINYYLKVELKNMTEHQLEIDDDVLPWANKDEMIFSATRIDNGQELMQPISFGGLVGPSKTIIVEPEETIVGNIPFSFFEIIPRQIEIGQTQSSSIKLEEILKQTEVKVQWRYKLIT